MIKIKGKLRIFEKILLAVLLTLFILLHLGHMGKTEKPKNC